MGLVVAVTTAVGVGRSVGVAHGVGVWVGRMLISGGRVGLGVRVGRKATGVMIFVKPGVGEASQAGRANSRTKAGMKGRIFRRFFKLMIQASTKHPPPVR